MAGFTDVHVTAAVAAELERSGWSASEPRARDLAAAAARGTNLIVEAPPSPWHGLPVLAGLLSAPSERPRHLLVLAPAAALDEWSEAIAPLALAAQLPLLTAAGPARAARQLAAFPSWILLTTPAIALNLVQRSALKCAELTGLVIVWPEQLGAEAAIEALMADLDKDAPRAVITSVPELMTGLGDRYARRALQVTLPAPVAPAVTDVAPIGAIGKIYFATVARRQRAAAASGVLETLDPNDPYLWAPARTVLARSIAEQSGVTLLTGDDRPEGQRPLVIALELPTPVRLAALSQTADVVLLVPASALAWARRVSPAALALRLPGALEAAVDEGAQRRSLIAARLDTGLPADGLLTLAPLFERYDPATVAAALYALWTDRPAPTVSVVSSSSASPTNVSATGTARVWVSLGKKDGGTANDLVGCLTRECRVDRTQIGRIELRDTFSLIEVPAADAEKIADRLTGISIRARRVTARVDKGVSGSAGDRPPRSGGSRPTGSRGPRPPSRRPTSGG
ncbi:MAG: DbpA RNA binding domain-containing protein [Gemmatimonadota bacterium]